MGFEKWKELSRRKAVVCANHARVSGWPIETMPPPPTSSSFESACNDVPLIPPSKPLQGELSHFTRWSFVTCLTLYKIMSYHKNLPHSKFGCHTPFKIVITIQTKFVAKGEGGKDRSSISAQFTTPGFIQNLHPCAFSILPSIMKWNPRSLNSSA